MNGQNKPQDRKTKKRFIYPKGSKRAVQVPVLFTHTTNVAQNSSATVASSPKAQQPAQNVLIPPPPFAPSSKARPPPPTRVLPKMPGTTPAKTSMAAGIGRKPPVDKLVVAASTSKAQPKASTSVPVSKTRRYVDNAKAWLPTLHPDDHRRIKICEKFHLPFQVKNTHVSSNPHEISAYVRTFMTYRALGWFHKTLSEEQSKLLILDIYGSPRTLKFNDACNQHVDHAEMMDIRTYRPLIVSADLSREMFAPRNNDLALLEKLPKEGSLLFVDVYETEDGPLTPDWLLDHMDVGDRAVWIGHSFSGALGSVFDEGAWLRTGEEIEFRPDTINPTVYKHDACDWLWQHSLHRRNDKTLFWSVKQTIGNYRMVIMKCDSSRHCKVLKDVPIETPPTWEFRDYKVPEYSGSTWLKKALRYVPDFLAREVLHWTKHIKYRDITVPIRLVTALNAQFSSRVRNDLSWKQALQGATKLIADDKEITLLAELFPKRFEN
jgi:hypothetical protein